MEPYKTRARKPEKVLCAAADYIEKYGWRQGAFGGFGGPACVMGAINTVAVSKSARVDAIWLLVKRLDATNTIRIVGWNDKPSQTKEKVVEVLRGDGC